MFSENYQKIRFFSGYFTKKSIFRGKFPTNFDFFRQFHKNVDFPAKNWLFTAISRQIILFLFKSHHFRTYFLYMIRGHPFMTSTKNSRFWPPSPCPHGLGPPHPLLWTSTRCQQEIHTALLKWLVQWPARPKAEIRLYDSNLFKLYY